MPSIRKRLPALAVAAISATLVAPVAPAQAEPSPAELTRRIEKASTELEQVVEAHNTLAEDLKANKATLARLTARLGPLEQQVARSRAEVNQLAVAAYKTGELGTATALLRPDDATTLVNRLTTVDRLAQERQKRITAVTNDQRQLLAQRSRLEATVEKAAAQARGLASTRKRIERDLADLYELRRQAYGRATEAAGTSPDQVQTAPSVSGAAGVAVRYAYGALGKPYRWGGDDGAGYDCSGLTSAAWRAAGKSLPHSTRRQWEVVAHLKRHDLSPGDLVFYRGLGHVALYVGNGQIIDAPTAGRNVLKRDMNIMPIVGYGRVR
ncbi:NlpC/P60 family protein [Salinispora sp. H7-4]|uniref:C40 family peptidase n=1 Tax=Salinispora sp. H7-4 TaxID=2748321 RepID=UPI0015D19348|nr:NlpC/P60 family protein [Salinispora sp. H7-4]NYT92756.1 C40 family peptidase [Salinispora sp. H7-4]